MATAIGASRRRDMLRRFKPVYCALAAFLLADATLGLLGLPSLLASGEMNDDRSAKIALFLLAIGNAVLTVRPTPVGIIFNGGAVFGLIASQQEHDFGTIVWIVLSLAFTAIAALDLIEIVRAVPISEIHARIEEEIIDGSAATTDPYRRR
jgi:hypothetical protein